ncbi:phosphotransferase [Longimicrobium sp.]|uniref:phosphotransferase n=1 Tax=Longimicrobium sp. TaxID=2029185 RepID=UPI003B3B7E82
MLRIDVAGSLSSGFAPAYGGVRTLELQGPVFDSGAFGDVYDLVAVNGAPPPSPQIVKVFRDNGFDSARRGFETIEKLQRKILDGNRDRAASGKPLIQTLPALRALPQFSFQGQMGSKAVYGYSADRLDTAGYLPLSKVLDPDEDPEPRRRYVAELSIEDRLLLAHELADGMQALRSLSYIHADINPPNLFVNIDECHTALIDFDSGAVTADPNETPTTFGKKTDGEWVAPEIMDQILGHRAGPVEVRVDRYTDDWALTVGIHYLLFLCGPFFVLQRSSSKHIREYVTGVGWPAYAPRDPLFTPGLENNHDAYLAMLGELPAGVRKRMSDALNRGAVQPGRRALPYQWIVELGGAQEPLEIILFHVEPEATLEGSAVRLTWRVTGSRWVTIDTGVGEVGETGTCEVVPPRNTSWTLTATARGGSELSETASVRVFPPPLMRTLTVPAPELSHTVVLRDVHVAAPAIALPRPVVRLGAPDIRIPLGLNLSVHVAAQPTPALLTPTLATAQAPAGATAGWGWMGRVPKIGDVFDRLCERVKAELNSRFGAKP